MKAEDAKYEVKVLADKLLEVFDHSNNAHYRLLMEGEIVGHPVAMTGAAVVTGGQRVRMRGGGIGMVFDEHPDCARYRRWSAGKFTDEDEAEADKWREQSRKLNMEKMKNELWRKAKEIPKPSDLKEAQRLIVQHFSVAPQYMLLSTVLELFKFSQRIRAAAIHRWRISQQKSFDSFAPYCCYVLRVVFLYIIGLTYGIVTTKPTNAIDLEYLF